MTLRYSTDIVIFGGGVAGLWLLNRLRQQGYDALLLESDTLGGGQTIASQGIIHGGLKYALGGSLTGAAQAIADMPARWRRALAGQEVPDLSAVRVLSEHYYMWSDAGIRSRLKTFLGSKSLRGRVEAVKPAEVPELFRNATVPGSLYRLPDFVVDAPSLIAALSRPVQEALFHIDRDSIAFQRCGEQSLESVSVRQGNTEVRIAARQFIFTAGAGNQDLIAAARLDKPKTQERPLHMVYLARPGLPKAQVHCIGDSFSLSPKLTLTSHSGRDDETVWYLGGELAESGVSKSRQQQIDSAKTLLQELFPWIDLSGARWDTFTINRAEANVNNDYRPDDAYYVREGNAIVAWPTKLTLAPVLADKIIKELGTRVKAVESGAGVDLAALRQQLPAPAFAQSHWDGS